MFKAFHSTSHIVRPNTHIVGNKYGSEGVSNNEQGKYNGTLVILYVRCVTNYTPKTARLQTACRVTNSVLLVNIGLLVCRENVMFGDFSNCKTSLYNLFALHFGNLS